MSFNFSCKYAAHTIYVLLRGLPPPAPRRLKFFVWEVRQGVASNQSMFPFMDGRELSFSPFSVNRAARILKSLRMPSPFNNLKIDHSSYIFRGKQLQSVLLQELEDHKLFKLIVFLHFFFSFLIFIFQERKTNSV